MKSKKMSHQAVKRMKVILLTWSRRSSRLMKKRRRSCLRSQKTRTYSSNRHPRRVRSTLNLSQTSISHIWSPTQPRLPQLCKETLCNPSQNLQTETQTKERKEDSKATIPVLCKERCLFCLQMSLDSSGHIFITSTCQELRAQYETIHSR